MSSNTQTEGFEDATVWTQFPPSDNFGLGWGRNFDDQKLTEKVDYSSNENLSMTDITKINDERFSQFVSIAGKVRDSYPSEYTENLNISVNGGCYFECSRKSRNLSSK